MAVEMIRPLDSREHAHLGAHPDTHNRPPGLVEHSVIAMLGAGFCACFAGVLLLRSTFSTELADSDLLMWFSPLTWWPGLAFGYALNRRARSSAACFTWLSGAVVLGFLIFDLFWVTHSVARTLSVVFPSSQVESSPEDQLGIYQLFFVWPAMNAFSYSVGASIARLLPPRPKQH